MDIMEINSSLSIIVDATDADLSEREKRLRDKYVKACEDAKRRLPSISDEAVWWPRANGDGVERR